MAHKFADFHQKISLDTNWEISQIVSRVIVYEAKNGVLDEIFI